jgi:hypothetical protein
MIVEVFRYKNTFNLAVESLELTIFLAVLYMH